MKKNIARFIVVFMLVNTALFSLSACKHYDVDNQNESNVSIDTDFKDGEPQYYLNDNSAKSSEGYYFMMNNILYYYSNGSQKANALCSQVDCSHTDSKCDAYFSSNGEGIKSIDCVGGFITYYKDNLYMVEQQDNTQYLVKYDKQGNNKQTLSQLSEDGKLIGFAFGPEGNIIASNGYLYFARNGMHNDDIDFIGTFEVCRISLSDNSSVEVLGEFDMAVDIYKTGPIILRAIGDRVYIAACVENRFKVKDYNLEYRLYSYDINNNSFKQEFNIESFEGTEGQINNWTDTLVFDENNNMYFTTYGDSAGYINCYNIDSKECITIYSQEYVKQDDERFLFNDMVYDGNNIAFIQVFTGVNGYNEIVIIDRNGKTENKLSLDTNYEYLDKIGIRPDSKDIVYDLRLNIVVSDNNSLMVASKEFAVAGLEWRKDDELTGKDTNMRKMPVMVIGTLDKSHINDDSNEWKKIMEYGKQ